MCKQNMASSCWVCGGGDLTLSKKSDIQDPLDSSDFEITDKNYGATAAIFTCSDCGFLQCSQVEDVLKFYEAMDDQDYEDTREQRSLQASKLLGSIKKFKSEGGLLDIGAGSGILVEQSLLKGYRAMGIEPSRALYAKALEHGLPVVNGVLPNEAVGKGYDLVTLVDIIEHVTDPFDLVSQASNVLAEDGVLVVVTPDASSVAAKLMGWRWWHFRIAHVGYFNEQNLSALLDKAGLEIVSVSRPSWYFPMSYLIERVLEYFPSFLRFKPPKVLQRITIPLNLFDSLTVVSRLKS